MLQKFRSMLKNEKGLTLIELLAVVVILGIIAAIAVPSIGNLIENSRKDAHVANANQAVSAARLLVVNKPELIPSTKKISLKILMDNNYLDNVKDPNGGSYDTEKSFVLVDTNNKITEVLLLTNEDKGVYGATKTTSVPVDSIKRDTVK